MAKKRCLLINQIFSGSVGTTLTVYGHDFIIQKNGSAIAEIDESFTKAEKKLGRYKVLEDTPVIKENFQKAHPVPRKDLLTDIGFEIKDFFGTNDINKLYKKIKNFDKDQTILFAETRLKLNLPESMPHTKMVKKISKAIELQSKPIDQPKTQKETLQDLDELEAKFNKG